MTRRNDKRSRLISAADKLFYEQGVNITTLANIAQSANIPLGNVYYYFKSKESIILAVIDNRHNMMQEQFKKLNTISTGKERLISFINQNSSDYNKTAFFGDTLGALCQELGKQTGEIAEAASELMQETVSWCEKQFITLGKGNQARYLAFNLISSLQGMSLLALALKDAGCIPEHAKHLIQSLETT